LIRFKRHNQEILYLKNIIFIDEAHRLTSSSPDRLHANDDEMVTLNLQTEILSNLLNEYRYQGISMMLSDQRVDALDYANNVGLKMYFKSSTSYSKNEYINEETLKIINFLKKRHVIVQFEDEEVLIKTPEFKINIMEKQNFINKQFSINESNDNLGIKGNKKNIDEKERLNIIFSKLDDMFSG